MFFYIWQKLMNIVREDELTEDEIERELLEWKLDQIYDTTRYMLGQLGLNKRDIAVYMTKLQQYKLVESPDDLANGAHLRYIPLDVASKDIKIAPCSVIFCKINDVAGYDDDCTWLVCRGYGLNHRVFQLCFNNYLFFQKFTNDHLALIHTARALYG